MFLKEWTHNKDYLDMLELMARLSNLFSDNEIPFLHYRLTENIFCKYFNAKNLSRSDTAYDAEKDNYGIGIKTFQIQNDSSTEKVAEFNAISSELSNYDGTDLAIKLANARNERILLGQRLYDIRDGCYHIIGRVSNGLTIFNTEYPLINIDKINSVKSKTTSLAFCDDKDSYIYNRSKSTLFKQFKVPEDRIDIPVSIIQDPFELLRKLLETKEYTGKDKDILSIHRLIQDNPKSTKKVFGVNYVILPLFSTKNKERVVPESSGLNQWNAGGRARSPNEVYIPIPSKINTLFPTFFPETGISFSLLLPNGRNLSAKACQDNRKALMSNPNIDLGKWILRDILQLKEGEFASMELLNRMGFDSVIVYKSSSTEYEIDVCRTITYSEELFDEGV